MNMKTSKLEQQYTKIAEYFNCPVSAVFMKKAGFHDQYITNVDALKISKNKIYIAQKYLAIFYLFPFVKMIGISGSVGSYTPREEDDIDIVFVVRKDALWLTRFLDFVILNAWGVRRRRNSENNKNKLCINLYLSYENLYLPNQDIYTAFQLFNVIPIYGEQTYSKLLNKNKSWLQRFIIDKTVFSYEPTFRSRFVSNFKNILYYLIYPFVFLINHGLKTFQIAKLKTHDISKWSYSRDHISTYRQDVRKKVLEFINT